MADWADPSAVARAAERWSNEQIRCRVSSHSWDPRSVVLNVTTNTYTMVEQCRRCRNQRVCEMDSRGYTTKWRTQYQEGYLLKGMGRVGVDGRAVLRLVSLRSLRVNEVRDDGA